MMIKVYIYIYAFTQRALQRYLGERYVTISQT